MEHRFATPRTEEEMEGPKTIGERVREFFWHHEILETLTWWVIVFTLVGLTLGVYIVSQTEIASIPFGFG